MTWEELIQENRILRSVLNNRQGGSKSALSNDAHESNTRPTPYIYPEIYCCCAADFTITFINTAWIELMNKEKEQIIGHSILELLDKEYHARIINLIINLSPDIPETSFEYSWNDKGQVRWRRLKIKAIFDANNILIEYVAVGYDITEHKDAAEQIRQRLNIEHALATASNRLIGTGEADMNEILRIIGEAIQVNRVYIFEIYDNLSKMNNTYDWCDAATNSVRTKLQNLDTKIFAWGLNQFLNNNKIVISDRSTLPPEAIAEKMMMEKQDIYASLLVPIIGINNKLLGYIGFDDTIRSRLWNNEDIQCLNMLAEMLGNYWERKKMEKSLRASEAQFRTLADTVPALIFVYTDPEEAASIDYLNNMREVVGYNKEGSLNMKCWDFVHPDFVELAKSRALARIGGEEVPSNYECKFLTKDGESRWGDLYVSTIEWEGQQALMGVIYDINERKQMEQELQLARDELEKRVNERTTELLLVNQQMEREIVERQQAEQKLILSEERYRAIIDDQSELVVRFLPDGTITFANEACCQYIGKCAEELEGKYVLPLVYKDDQAEVLAKIEALSLNYLEDFFTLRTLNVNGDICWQEWTGRGILKDQEIVEIQAVGRDVSERKHAEEALQRSEANFRKLAETAPAMIYVYSEGRLLYLNSMFETLTCMSKEELLQIEPMELFHPDCREQVIKNTIARQQGEKIPPYEVSMISKKGQRIWGYLYADTINFEDKPAILGIVADITERKIMEAYLLQNSKLESVGILAGGIAHDFNNILTVISGNISLAKIMLDANNDLNEILTEVEKAAFQARDLTQQLLTFSKGGAPIKETASIQELLRESASFVLRGSNVNCKYNIADNLWPVDIDKGQINQVINNLIINADQAMPEGGTIQLSADNIHLGSDLLPSLKAEHYIRISIKDTGIGIAGQHLSKIFDPYFTTKQKGHGLGLATCYSIIKKHDGEITFSSVLGIGTTVDVYLPAFPGAPIEDDTPAGAPLFGQGKILIMDDEAIVRETLGKMLTCLGYTAGFANDGLNAINLYKNALETNEAYDAILMDLTIAGGMGGKEAAKKILEIDVDAKMIVSSGYSNDPVMAEYKKYGFCGVLPKPYEIKTVNQVLYDCLLKYKT